MKYFLTLFIVASSLLNTMGQLSTTDSLIQLLEKAPNDTNRVKLLLAIANSFYFYKPDTSIAYSKKALQLATDLGFNSGIFQSLSLAGESARLLGDYPGAMKMQLEALDVSRKTKNANGELASLCFIGVIYNELKEYRPGLNYLLPANTLSQNLPVNPLTVFILTNIGISYHFLNMPDSALYYLRQASVKINAVNHPQLKSYIPINIGNVYAGFGHKDSALYYYAKALQNSLRSNESINLGRANQKLADLYFSEGKYDSSLYFVRNAFRESKRTAQKVNILEASTLLVKLYRQFHQMDSAFYFEDISTAMKDSLFGPEKFKQLQLLMLDKQEKQQEADTEQEQYRNNIKYTLLFISLGVFLLISFILFRANRQKQKAKTKIEKAYFELKETQALLIQREKMASLGELTAGIAHEIQNPLNFVNNFSEVNKELIEELKGERSKINSERSAPSEDALIENIKENEEKIHHHGRRADAIVKSMLQHARVNGADAGQNELTDINKLADEYLRLAYQGYRAKDTDFNCALQLDLDPKLPLVSVVPQDIGRVLLNLFNNAFYAVTEKSTLENSRGKHYKPSVSVSTKRVKDKIEIRVKDNGVGIPQKIVEKIFQPFFTTKPAGQGTGLGLSLAYDIVKSHKGELLLESREGEYSEFILQLPLNN